MTVVTGPALLGDDERHPLQDEIVAFADAIGSNGGGGGGEDAIAKARTALLQASGNRHALYDVAGILGFFSSMTKVVDFTGHYTDKMSQVMHRVATMLTTGRQMRQCLSNPFGCGGW